MQSWYGLKAFEQCLVQIKLVGLDGGHGLPERQASPTETALIALRKLLTECCSHPGEVLHCPKHASNGLKTLRSRLEFVWRLTARWTYLVRGQLVEQFVFTVEDACMRSEKLVGRACEKVTIQSLHIDGLV